MIQYVDRTWPSRDALTLHYRDYGQPDAQPNALPPVICLHGLTRNARDFANLAAQIAGQDDSPWRVLCPDLRGRGDSDHAKDPASYNPLQYVEDLLALCEDQGITRFVAIGTSLGGLMTLVLAMMQPDRIAGALLNDIGPVIEAEGLAKIGEYVGQGRSFPTWMHAARALRETHADTFPGYAVADWLAMARRTMTLTSVGRIVFDYDLKIAQAFTALDPDAPVPDLWPGIDALAGRPVTLVRGALSTLLSEATFAKMGRRLPDAELVSVPGIGHAPMLDEPEAVAAIDRLLARVAAG